METIKIVHMLGIAVNVCFIFFNFRLFKRLKKMLHENEKFLEEMEKIPNISAIKKHPEYENVVQEYVKTKLNSIAKNS